MLLHLILTLTQGDTIILTLQNKIKLGSVSIVWNLTQFSTCCKWQGQDYSLSMPDYRIEFLTHLKQYYFHWGRKVLGDLEEGRAGIYCEEKGELKEKYSGMELRRQVGSRSDAKRLGSWSVKSWRSLLRKKTMLNTYHGGITQNDICLSCFNIIKYYVIICRLMEIFLSFKQEGKQNLK